MFPIVITYKKKLDRKIITKTNQAILLSLKKSLEQTGVDKIQIVTDSALRFENVFFSIKPAGNWNIWVGIKNGKVEIKEKEGVRFLFYSFNALYILIASLIPLFVLIIINREFSVFTVGIPVFFILLVYTTTIARHSDFLTGALNQMNTD